MNKTRLIGLDWGTTSLRAYAIDEDGNVLARAEAPAGIQAIADGQFRQAFETLCAPWLGAAPPGVPILASGMIGSRQGWREAAYVQTPAGFEQLTPALLRLDDLANRPFAIVPGVMTCRADGTHDVMRGEETQVFGAMVSPQSATPGAAAGTTHATIVLPGTHSKWVTWRAGRIVAFDTYFTGELYAVLASHSLLGRLFAAGQSQDFLDKPAFVLGVQRAAAQPAALTRLLFSVRAEGLFGALSAQAAPSYLSGLLIGAELAAAMPDSLRPPTVTIIASPSLQERYALALEEFGVPSRAAPADVVVRGLFAIAKSARLL